MRRKKYYFKFSIDDALNLILFLQISLLIIWLSGIVEHKLCLLYGDTLINWREQIIPALSLLLGFTILIYIMIKHLEKRKWIASGLPFRKKSILWFGLGILFAGLFVALQVALLLLLKYVEVTNYFIYCKNIKEFLLFGITTGSIMFLGKAFANGIIFHSILFQRSEEHLGFWFATLISSFLFAIFHFWLTLTPFSITHWYLFLQSFLLSISLIALLRASGSLWFSLALYTGLEWFRRFFWDLETLKTYNVNHFFNMRITSASPTWALKFSSIIISFILLFVALFWYYKKRESIDLYELCGLKDLPKKPERKKTKDKYPTSFKKLILKKEGKMRSSEESEEKPKKEPHVPGFPDIPPIEDDEEDEKLFTGAY